MNARVGGHSVTPDGRYLAVRSRLGRMANQALAPGERDRRQKCAVPDGPTEVDRPARLHRY
jgi:hypothetical protein